MKYRMEVVQQSDETYRTFWGGTRPHRMNFYAKGWIKGSKLGPDFHDAFGFGGTAEEARQECLDMMRRITQLRDWQDNPQLVLEGDL